MDEPTPYLGEIFALLAALNWAFALVLFKRSGEAVSPLSLSLFKNVVAVVLFAALIGCFGLPAEDLAGFDSGNVWLLALSGILGIAIADTMLFHSLNRIGVGLLTIVECTYTPLMIAFSWYLVSEEITRSNVIGGALVLSAIFMVAGHKAPPGLTRSELLGGICWGIGAILLMVYGIVMVKPIIEEQPLIPVTVIRLLAGTVALAVIMALSKQRRQWFAIFKPAYATWKTCVPAAFFGSFLAMVFWIGGFKYTAGSRAAILNQTSTIMALIFATWILKEPFTRQKMAAACLAVAGVLVVTQGEQLWPETLAAVDRSQLHADAH
ncbi:MAG: DMT family transporter [Planctomycetota bacterium]|jgi:drug/metabolite transporter (DMT)-like permease